MLSGHCCLSNPFISQTGRQGAKFTQRAGGEAGRGSQVSGPDLTQPGLCPLRRGFGTVLGTRVAHEIVPPSTVNSQPARAVCTQLSAGSEALTDQPALDSPRVLATIPQGSDQETEEHLCEDVPRARSLAPTAGNARAPENSLTTWRQSPGMLFCPLNDKQVTRAGRNQESG